jgi:F-type H+-transporting ATPase subunit b
MEIVQNIALISINATMVVQLISFLLFVMLFNRVMIHPLRKVMTERESYQERMSEEVASVSQDYVRIGQKIKDQESDARKVAFELRDEIETAGKQSADVVLDKTRQEVNALKEKARQEADAKIACPK